MGHWGTLWKVLFIAGVGIFAAMAMWVTIAGFGDIRGLLAKLAIKGKTGKIRPHLQSKRRR